MFPRYSQSLLILFHLKTILHVSAFINRLHFRTRI